MQPFVSTWHLLYLMSTNLSKFDIKICPNVVELAQRGDISAHENIFQLFSPAVYLLALNTIRHKQVAEDILQNTFVNTINKIHQFRNQCPFGMWLRKITVNQILMHIRKNKTKDNLTESIDNEDNVLDINHSTTKNNHMISTSHQLQIELDLQTLLDKLPLRTRTVLWLKEVEGYTHEEIGFMMGKTASYSKSSVARAYQVLRSRYNANKPDKLHGNQ